MKLETRTPAGNWWERENWYRMKERETKLVKAELDVGTEFVAHRVIVRAGYYYEHMECPTEELNQRALKVMADRLGMSTEKCKHIVINMQQYRNEFDYYGHSRFSIDAFNMTQKYNPLKGLYYLVRREWVADQPKWEDTHAYLRTFWYADVPDGNVYHVLDKKMKMIGSPEWEEDCTWFNEIGRQQLYRVRKKSGSYRYVHNRYLFDDWFVHPDDAVEVK